MRRLLYIAILLMVGCEPPPGGSDVPINPSGQECFEPPMDMVAWWPMDDPTGQSSVKEMVFGYDGTVLDRQGNVLNIASNLSLPSAVQLSGSNVGVNPVVVDPLTGLGALYLTEAYVFVPHYNDLNIPSHGEYTFTLWIYPDPRGTQTYIPILEKYDHQNNDGYKLYLKKFKGQWFVFFEVNNSGPLMSANPVVLREWNFIAVKTYKPVIGNFTSAVNIFVCPTSGPTCGIPNITKSTNKFNAPRPTQNTEPLKIGMVDNKLCCSLGIDEVEFFSRALRDAEILRIFYYEREGLRKCWQPCEVPDTTGTSATCVDTSNLPIMKAWWPLDETAGNTAFDLKGVHHGTILPNGLGINVLSFAGQKVDNSYLFPMGWVSVPHSPDLEPGFTNFSIDYWLFYELLYTVFIAKVDTFAVFDTVAYDTVVSGYLFEAYNGILNFKLFDGTSKFPTVTLSTNIQPGQWHFIVGVVDRNINEARLYVDGNLVASQPIPPGSVFASNSPLLFGNLDQFNNMYFMLDEIEIFKDILTQQHINDIFNADSLGKCKPRK